MISTSSGNELEEASQCASLGSIIARCVQYIGSGGYSNHPNEHAFRCARAEATEEANRAEYRYKSQRVARLHG